MITLSRNWWAVALRGLAAILFGLAALFIPAVTLAALVLLFGAYAIVDGVLALVAAVRAAERHARWSTLLTEGLVGVAIGVVTFAWPAVTALGLLYLIAFWAIATGIAEIMAAIRLRREIAGEWVMGVAGALSIVFGALLAVFPGAGILAVVWLVGVYAVLFGALLIGLAVRLRAQRPTTYVAPRRAREHVSKGLRSH